MTPKLSQFTLLLILNIVKAHIVFDWEPANPAFDPGKYEEALDSELCSQHLEHINGPNSTTLRFRFLEAGLRIPRAIFQLNNLDMGNYVQCLGIHEETDNIVIEGKYCMIRGPINENFIELAETMNSQFDLSEEDLENFQLVDKFKTQLTSLQIGDSPRTNPGYFTIVPTFRMAVCVPKTCTTREGLTGLLFNLTLLNLDYEDQFCRFKEDKPWSPGLYVAIVIFSLIGLVTILSTSYDVRHIFIQRKDPKTASSLYKSFSLYTNAIRLTTFTANPNNLNCVDGIRAISIFWIIIGHTLYMLPALYNYIDAIQWMTELSSTWVTAAPFAVDTFFFLSGLLVVYTTAGKLSGMKMLRSLHLFYLHRILRMFPLLATIILMQATIFHYIVDGPQWNSVAENVDNCRLYWWAALLYVQNYVGFDKLCIRHSWYLAIDMQCYILSPIVLFWVLSGKKKYAWTSLTVGLLTALTAGATYSFIYNFRGWILATTRPGGETEYDYYYINTITRASPFFVGMWFGYVLHIWKGTKPRLPQFLVIILWICSITIISSLMYVTHLMKDLPGKNVWDKWVVDDLFNSFARSIWAAAVGWIIFACQYGYGGPVNWFLCLHIWKLPSRISYGMYLFHYPLQFIIQGSALQPLFFNDSLAFYECLRHIVLAYAVSFFMTLVIESPCTVLFKLMMGGGPKKPQKDIAVKD